MVDDGGPVGLDDVQVAFDDERVVSDAGIMLAATLAERLQIEDLVDDCVRLGVRGAASRAGRKVMALVHAMALGADSIDDCEILRAGRTGRSAREDLGAVDVGTVPARVHIRACPPARSRARRDAEARVGGRCWSGRRPFDRRCRLASSARFTATESRAPRSATPQAAAIDLILASRAESGEVLHLRLRKGSANTQRGICASQTS